MKIALAGPYPARTLEQFQALLPDQEFFPVETQEDYEALTDVDCIIVRVLKTPEAVLANKPNLKAVIRWGAGYDSVDVQAAGRRGIPVLNTPGVNAYAVAELALGMMITLNRKVLGYWSNVQQGNWDRGAFISLSLNHKTVGIVGGGNIGRRVAALVQALGAQVVYYDAFRLPLERERELQMTYAPLEELLEQADLVSLHVPLLDSTRHIIGAEQLARMKPTYLGITGLSLPRVHIDGVVWHLDVGSSHPGAVVGPKGWAVRPLKRYASWVQNVVRQFGPYPAWA